VPHSYGRHLVLCSAAVEEQVPSFLQGRNQGWVTSEYAMIPPSSPTRIPWNRGVSGGRQQEISRLIGRGLRAAIDMKKLGERQIMLDCTVLQTTAAPARRASPAPTWRWPWRCMTC